MTGAVNYEQFVQLLNWRDHPLPREGRTKDTNGLSIISRSSVVLITFSLQTGALPVTASFSRSSSLPHNL